MHLFFHPGHFPPSDYYSSFVCYYMMCVAKATYMLLSDKYCKRFLFVCFAIVIRNSAVADLDWNCLTLEEILNEELLKLNFRLGDISVEDEKRCNIKLLVIPHVQHWLCCSVAFPVICSEDFYVSVNHHSWF